MFPSNWTRLRDVESVDGVARRSMFSGERRGVESTLGKVDKAVKARRWTMIVDERFIRTRGRRINEQR